MRHDEPKMLWAKKAKLVFNDVEAEPWLEPLCGEEFGSKRAKMGDDVRSDVRIRGSGGINNKHFSNSGYYTHLLRVAFQRP